MDISRNFSAKQRRSGNVGSRQRNRGAAVFTPAATRRVAVLIESSRSYGRGLLLGVAQYARERANWQMDYQERELQSGVAPWLEHWEGDGVLARIEEKNLARCVTRLGVPVVDLRRMGSGSTAPSVHTDEVRLVEMVVEHLRERAFRNFGFCGYTGLDYSDMRASLLRDALAGAGFQCNTYGTAPPTRRRFTVEFEQVGLEAGDYLEAWLRELPKPVGIMACNDVRGQQVLNACRKACIAVPEQVAVVGVDNDEVLCELSAPPLSSVAPDTRRIGYEAAALLDRLMDGETTTKTDYYIEPLEIVTRRSTDTVVIPHAGAARALAFLRRHYQEKITLKDVASDLQVTLRSIQEVFKAHVGRTLHQELDRLRVDRARRLLQDHDLKLEAIAEMSGFSNRRHFRRTFEREIGQTPQEHRQELKRRLEPR